MELISGHSQKEAWWWVKEVCPHFCLLEWQEESILPMVLWESFLIKPLPQILWLRKGSIHTWHLLKLKIDLPYNHSIWLLDTYLKECKSIYNTDICICIFIAALFTIAKMWDQPRCPTTNEWIKKIWYTYIPWTITH
jgi:hypothetical protein